MCTQCTQYAGMCIQTSILFIHISILYVSLYVCMCAPLGLPGESQQAKVKGEHLLHYCKLEYIVLCNSTYLTI